MSKQELFDIRCALDNTVICPAKSDIVRGATGDPTGHTETGSEQTDFVVNIKLRERNTQARLRGCEGLSEDNDCSVRDDVNESPIRRHLIDAGRGLVHKLIRQPS